MNNSLRTTSIVTVLIALVAFAGVTAAFAQGPNQPDGSTSPGTNRTGNPAGLGAMAVDEAAIHTAIASTLGMSVEDFETAIAAGETPFTLAQQQGVDFAEVQAAMDAAHEAALQQAVANGLISQEQATWILSHRGGQGRQGLGMNSSTSGGRMGRGAGGMGPNARGNSSQAGQCLYQVP